MSLQLRALAARAGNGIVSISFIGIAFWLLSVSLRLRHPILPTDPHTVSHMLFRALPTAELVLGSMLDALTIALILAFLAVKGAPWLRRLIKVLSLSVDCTFFYWIAVVGAFAVVELFGETALGAGSGSISGELINTFRTGLLLALVQIPSLIHELVRQLETKASFGKLLLSALSVLSRLLPATLSSDILLELTFAWPGLGRSAYDESLQGAVRATGDALLFMACIAIFARALHGDEPLFRLDRGARATRRCIIICVSIFLAIAVVHVAAAFSYANAVAIDNIHWQGYPIKPCFLQWNMCGGHLMGTDEVGRDLLARLIAGGAVSLETSLLVTLLASVLGLLIGSLGRYTGTAVRYAMRRVADALSGLLPWPTLLLLAILLTMHRHDLRLPLWIVVLPASVLFCAKAISLGVESWSPAELAAHVFALWPNVLFTLATIDALGFGIQSPIPSWGNILGNMQANIETAPWAVITPMLCLFFAALLMRLAHRYLLHADAREIETPALLSEG